MSEILTTHQLTIGYKKRRKKIILAQDLNLCLKTGELVCLIGQNGTGKSTLIQTLVRLLRPLKGNVCILHQFIHQINAQKLAQQIALVLTTPIFANFTVWELVSTGRYPYTGQFGLFSDHDIHHIKQALLDTKMLDFAHRKVASLSDGERQKVMISRALAQDTSILILDEPTAHLDLPNRVMIFDILRKLAQKRKKAILVSTHELDLALQVADKIWLQAHQTVKVGSPETLVLDGDFEDVFQKERLFFEKNTGRFKILHPEKMQIHVAIDGVIGTWTKHAIERVGGKHISTILYPKITYQEMQKKWLLQTKAHTDEFVSLTELTHRVSEMIEHDEKNN